MRRSTVVLVLVVLAALACASDPQRTPQRETVPPLPPLPANATPAEAPQNPYEPLAEGVVARTRFAADSARHRIEVRDLIVAPNRRGAETRFEGAAILLVRQGRGTARGLEAGELAPGRTLSVPQGARFSLDNASDKHLVIRAYVLIPR